MRFYCIIFFPYHDDTIISLSSYQKYSSRKKCHFQVWCERTWLAWTQPYPTTLRQTDWNTDRPYRPASLMFWWLNGSTSLQPGSKMREKRLESRLLLALFWNQAGVIRIVHIFLDIQWYSLLWFTQKTWSVLWRRLQQLFIWDRRTEMLAVIAITEQRKPTKI